MLRWLALFWTLPGLALAQMSFAISDYAPDAPVAGQVEIGNFAFTDDRMSFPLTVALPDLWAQLDALARARGNLTGQKLEFHWLGPTEIKSIEDGAVTLASRGRLMTDMTVSAFGFSRTETLRATSGFDMRLTPLWDRESKTLKLGTELLDIHDLPDWAKEAIAGVGVPLAVDLPLFSATSGELDALDLDLGDLSLAGEGAGAVLGATVSLSAQAGRQALMQLLYKR